MVLLVTVKSQRDQDTAMIFYSERFFYFNDIASKFTSGLFYFLGYFTVIMYISKCSSILCTIKCIPAQWQRSLHSSASYIQLIYNMYMYLCTTYILCPLHSLLYHRLFSCRHASVCLSLSLLSKLFLF